MLPVVYDGVGKDTFVDSLDCLRPRGLMVSFGNASGAPEPLELQMLAARGSLYITRPTMLSYTATPEELQQSSEVCDHRDALNFRHSGGIKKYFHGNARKSSS